MSNGYLGNFLFCLTKASSLVCSDTVVGNSQARVVPSDANALEGILTRGDSAPRRFARLFCISLRQELAAVAARDAMTALTAQIGSHGIDAPSCRRCGQMRDGDRLGWADLASRGEVRKWYIGFFCATLRSDSFREFRAGPNDSPRVAATGPARFEIASAGLEISAL